VEILKTGGHKPDNACELEMKRAGRASSAGSMPSDRRRGKVGEWIQGDNRRGLNG